VAGSARHITSTTITTFGGFLPLILGGGGFWPPFAMAIAGGVALSVTLAFALTPQLFALTLPRRAAARAPRISRWRRGSGESPHPEHVPPGPR
jgi:predicted RND superfamily exporter protein